MKTFATKILTSLAVLALTFGSLTAGEKKQNKSSNHDDKSKSSSHDDKSRDKCHDKCDKDWHWPSFPSHCFPWWPNCDKKCPPCEHPGHGGWTPPGPGGTNSNPGGGTNQPPVTQKFRYRVEHEYKQGYGYDRYPVTVVGTYNTRAEAEAIAQRFRDQGFATRIIEVPIRNIPGDLTPGRPGDLRGFRGLGR